MKTTARLTHQKIRFELPFRCHLVVDLEAPHLEWESRRPPVCIIPVIDVSGSMRGAKLDRAKRSVQRLVDNLSTEDLCGVVTFTDDVSVLSPPVRMSPAEKDALKASLERLEALGSTNLAGGMLEGLRLANQTALPQGMRVRVILFTDGLPNVGVASTSADLLPLLARNLGRATLSAFGYGADADQELLRDLSTRGKGNYAFVAGPDDAMTAFARELGGLLSTYAQDIVLRVRPADGNAVRSVISDMDAEPEGSGVRIRLPDILADERRHVVLAVDLGPVAASTASPCPAFEVDLELSVIGQEATVARRSASLQVMVERVVPGAEQQLPTPELDVIVAQAELVRAQIEAEELARRGEHRQAHRRVLVLFESAVARGHPAVAHAAREVAETMRDAGAYQASTAYRSSMRKGVGRSSTVMMEPAAAETLAGMGLACPTAAQEQMEKRFQEEPPGEAAERRKPRRPTSTTPPGTPGGLRRRRARRW
jgi:Ca-activated chloride channel family protein